MPNSPCRYSMDTAVRKRPGAQGRENYLLISEYGLERQRSQEDPSRNKGCDRHHLPTLLPSISTRPPAETSAVPTLAYTMPCPHWLQWIYPFQLLLPQSWCCRFPPLEDHLKSHQHCFFPPRSSVSEAVVAGLMQASHHTPC